MIERIAEAIYREFEARPTYAQAQMNGHLAVELAIAAVRAMREPSPEMCAATDELDIYWNYRGEALGGPDDVWRAMIDAILSQPQEDKAK